MFLTKHEILKEIRKGNIKIEPFDEKAVGPISIDLTLGDEFGFLTKKEIALNEALNYKNCIKTVKTEKLKLKPDDFVLGITKERITLPKNIAGYLGGRSRFARLGLLVHATAPLIHPGISNKQIFEIKNISKSSLILYSGLKIGQVAFIRLKGNATYEGVFKQQEEIK
ncbi:MAG: dCTP deaminase [Candidatus Pacearchaeota archaeon]|nr:dCTP deaminase [Candidatus Pacearchaeota archaeon]